MKTAPIIYLLFVIAAGTTHICAAQEKFQMTKSMVSFFSEAPLENIEAQNTEAKGIVDMAAKTFSFRVPIKNFEFDKKLMQEHFNENYMESEKYPSASFKGKIDGTYNHQKNGTYPVTATGELEIHGVKQSRSIPATIEVKDGTIHISSAFKVKLADHKIEIPTIVFNKIAEEVEVKISSDLVGIK